MINRARGGSAPHVKVKLAVNIDAEFEDVDSVGFPARHNR